MLWASRTPRAAGSPAAALGLLALAIFGAWGAAGFAQQAAHKETAVSPGDEPANPGPLAAELSPALRTKPIRAAMKKVADWEVARVEAQPPSRSWDFGVLDIGLMAAARTLHEPRYSNYVASVGEHFGWKLERTTTPANDFVIAQAFLEVYRSSHNEAQLAPLRRQFDDAVALLNDPNKPIWGWCDALFMAPPAGVTLSDITADNTYNAYVDREWGKTGKALYDRQKHLFARDAGSLNKREKNGEKFFWARSNGMAMAGTVRVLADLPSDDPLRPQYIELLREMAASVAAAQQTDGLWRPGMLDAGSYPLPEVAGSALFTYAIAWGINHHMLDAATYLPVVERAWGGLLTHVYADGRLGAIQPMGEAPAEYKAGSSYNFGVGAFLLVGSEMDVLSGHKHW
ncbi:MAG: glycoside hydrolase family 88 protein [Terracidiphilus sp.]|nr:glycoside hydrolase family 88 protein [Terracidiphilus sp.]